MSRPAFLCSLAELNDRQLIVGGRWRVCFMLGFVMREGTVCYANQLSQHPGNSLIRKKKRKRKNNPFVVLFIINAKEPSAALESTEHKAKCETCWNSFHKINENKKDIYFRTPSISSNPVTENARDIVYCDASDCCRVCFEKVHLFLEKGRWWWGFKSWCLISSTHVLLPVTYSAFSRELFPRLRE